MEGTMKKRIAKKILKNKDKLHYSQKQIEKAEKKMAALEAKKK